MLPEIRAVPAGRFLRGSASGRPDEAPVCAVEVAAFWLGRTPVTNAQYAAFSAACGTPPAPFASDPRFAHPAQPVVAVTWFEAAGYCGWLSRETGSVWRLPSESEWERAARGGLEQAPTAWGDAVPAGEVPTGELDGPWPVGLGTPNGFDLLDMGTIVHEWCRDVYVADLGSETATGPESPGTAATIASGTATERRASRGGSWRHHVRWSPPSARSSLPPGSRYADYGFRVLREGR